MLGVASAATIIGNNEPVLINKQFVSFTGPEDDIPQQQTLQLGKTQKNFRVLFVNVPSVSAQAHIRRINNQEEKIHISQAPIENKLALYVLSGAQKELSENDIATPAPTQPAPPEVIFLNYDNENELPNLQEQIRSQYNN